MYDARTIICCNVVAEDYTESFALHLDELVASVLACEHLLGVSGCIFDDKLRCEVVHLLARLNPRHKLLIVHTLKLGALEVACDAPWTLFLLLVKRSKLALCALLLRLQVSLNKILCHNESHWLAAIEVVCLYRNIINLRSNAKRHVRRQGPRCCGPSHEIRLTPLCPLCLRILDEELYRSSEVLDITIATWLVELVRRQTGTSTWRIRLDCIALIKQALVVELLEEPPQCLDILVVVCNIWMVEVDKIAHLLCKLTPLGSKHHHILTALVVVIFCRDILL